MTDFIQIYDNALSLHQCNKSIEYIDNQVLVPGETGDGIYNPKSKDVQEVRPVPFLGDGTIVSEYLIQALSTYTLKYRSTYPSIDKVTSWSAQSHYTLKKYDPGQGYHAVHCENTGMKVNISRMLVWMFYFNTITDDGGTFFPEYDRIIDAVEGRLVIWPAYWTHVHKGIVSETQTKYIASGWYGFINE